VCALALAQTMCFPGRAALKFLMKHTRVEIFINEEKKLTVAVQESKEFDVYRVLVQPLNQLLIIPDGQIVPAIYQKVFGPASYKACDDYVKQHAKAA
jgi:uncharacterized protein YbdZ (MbtH family)